MRVILYIRGLWLFLLFSGLVKAQVSDNFSDLDFTANPAWSGTTADYTVNASAQLQLNASVAGTSYLSTPSALVSNTQWSFYIKQAFAPSGSNFGRVYLASDQANLTAPLNGYYLQFGEAGSNDAVELFRQTGTTSVSVARGTDGAIASSFTISVKVTCDNSGNWNLYVDPAAGTAYQLQATGNDNTFTTSTAFGYLATYTASNITNFYLDTVYVGAIVVDTTPPSISGVTVTGPASADVLFSEPVELNSSQNTSNYVIPGLTVSSALRDNSNFSLVHLTFQSAMVNNTTYQLTVSNVSDFSANVLNNGTQSFTYSVPGTAVFRDVVINEIFADPSPQVGLPNAEFFELYNRSSTSFDLNGWVFSDGSTSATLSSYILQPQQYLILCPTANVADYSAYGAVMGLPSFPSLNNAGDHLSLTDNNAVAIDSVSYLDSWYDDDVKKDGGWTLELINPGIPSFCAGNAVWTASQHNVGGTPGTVNSVFNNTPDLTAPAITSVASIGPNQIFLCFSEPIPLSVLSSPSSYSISSGITISSVITDENCVTLNLNQSMSSGITYMITCTGFSDCSGNNLNPATVSLQYYEARAFDVLINEIMADPSPSAGLPDYEYLELFNRTASSVALNGWTLHIGSSIETLPSVNIPAGGYLILTIPDAVNAFSSYSATAGVSGLSSSALTNSGTTLSLANASGTIIHAIQYSDGWYHNKVKAEGGWSLEMKDPLNPCGEEGNWAVSISSTGGTPGTLNSVSQSNADNVPPYIERIAFLDLYTITVHFSEPLLLSSLYNFSAYSASPGLGNPIFAAPDQPLHKQVTLRFNTSMQQGIIYTLTVSGLISDCAGNPVDINLSGRFGVPEEAASADILVNEVLSDPLENGTDFVEVYNQSGKIIDLGNLRIGSWDPLSFQPIDIEWIDTTGYLIFPGDYIVITESRNGILPFYTLANKRCFAEIASLPSMSISEGTVGLFTKNLTGIDYMTYNESMHFPLLNDTKGVSLERLSPDRPSTDVSNWHSASETAGFATPGAKNSQFIENESAENVLTLSTEIFSPDNDGYQDVLQIAYQMDEPGYVANGWIYDVRGMLVKKLIDNELLGTSGYFSWDGIDQSNVKASIGIFTLYFEYFNTKGETKKTKKTFVLAGKL